MQRPIRQRPAPLLEGKSFGRMMFIPPAEFIQTGRMMMMTRRSAAAALEAPGGTTPH